MKLKPPDSSIDDYKARRREFLLALDATDPPMMERLHCMQRWFTKNSPYTEEEKLQNVRKALYKDGI